MGLVPLRLLAGACPCRGALPIPSELAEIKPRSVNFRLCLARDKLYSRYNYAKLFFAKFDQAFVLSIRALLIELCGWTQKETGKESGCPFPRKRGKWFVFRFTVINQLTHGLT
ncbi:uncharacterized protein BDR25DRAFT_355575 [Lindgomyces ingoldianus]|uniref:Uncharacterized protein n=1 Tax=Lindgomyces ingoldianus TaxID=673940 RepID=A0ACB6QWN2_9PLEO|nr:uncharacterized protein BDR25DRAFT_355575 [Lindgomyces ingoldianus]KAF2470480.1 hypothetical protein BDR25DRAFT_355575 [Lindgomyces ingoldianus]